MVSRIIDLGPGQGAVEDLAAIRMSPHEFKLIADVMMRTINTWEEVFGDIKVTWTIIRQDQMKKMMEDMKKKVEKGV